MRTTVSVVLSPMRITQHGSGRSFRMGEVHTTGSRQVIILPQFSDISRCGSQTVPCIDLALSKLEGGISTKLDKIDQLHVFLHSAHLDLIEPLVAGVPRHKLTWISCHHTSGAKNRIHRAGHADPQVLEIRKCADDNDAGYLVWNLLHRGVATLVKPGSHIAEGEPISAAEHDLYSGRPPGGRVVHSSR